MTSHRLHDGRGREARSGRRRQGQELLLLFAPILIFVAERGQSQVPFSSGIGLTTDSAPPGAIRVIAVDLDGDGDLDLGYASGDSGTVTWLENLGGGTFDPEPNVLTTVAATASALAAADLDGDGDLDVISGNGNFMVDRIAWYENLGNGTFGSQIIISTLADNPTSVVVADLDGDGDLDVLSTSSLDDEIAWYENLGGATFGVQEILTTDVDGPTSGSAVDLDGDGDPDVLATGSNGILWLENLGNGSFGAQPNLVAGHFARSVIAADLDGDGDLDVIAIDADSVVWYENPGGAAFDPLDSELVHPIAVTVAPQSVFATDLDGDGDPDVVFASNSRAGFLWSENLGDGSFATDQLHEISATAVGASSALAADLDGDGDRDVVGVSEVENTVVWFRNETIHRSAAFPQQLGVSPLGGGPNSVFAGDLDSDGDLDVVVAGSSNKGVAWYENPGDGGLVFAEHEITDFFDRRTSVFVADLDRDGDLDILSTSRSPSFHDLIWFENDGGADPSFSEHFIADVFQPGSVFAADLDGDGDLDIVTSARDPFAGTILWFENDGAASPTFTQHTLASFVQGGGQVFVADLDRDGDLDVLAVAGNFDEVAWYENDGAANPSFTKRTIVDFEDPDPADGAADVIAADLDSDGDLDVVSASVVDDKIAWYENNGAADPTFTPHVIVDSTDPENAADGAFQVLAADLDGDGDLDPISASLVDGKIAWYENDGASSPQFTKHLIAVPGDPRSIFAIDLDGDGDTDVLSADFDANRVYAYPNRGGQLALRTTDVAQQIVANGELHDLLAIEVVHRGRAGDGDVEVALLELRFTDDAGVPLTTAQAQALVESLLLVLDDGDGLFDPALDQEVASLNATAFGLDGSGVLSFALADDGSDLRVAPGASKTYFVVAEIAAGADSASLGAFRVTHLTSASSSGEDADHDLPLRLEHSPDIGTGVIDTELTSASCQSPFDLVLADRTIATTIVCEAGTTIRAGDTLGVVSPGDLTLRAGRSVGVVSVFSVGGGGTVRIVIDPSLEP